MTGPTIQQLKQANPETLWQFLASLPGSMEAQILYGLLIAGAVGMIAHYVLRWLSGEIAGSLVKYLFLDYPRRTALAYAGVIGSAVAAIASNVFVTDSGTFVGWLNVLWLGLTNGYAADSIANKGRGGGGSDDKEPSMVSIQPGGKVTAGPAAVLAAVLLGALAVGYGVDARAQAGNLGGTVLPSAARTATQVNSLDQINLTWSGASIIVNISGVTSGSYTPKIQGKDPVSGAYYDILVGPTITSTSTTVLKVYPGVTAAANLVASDVIPRTWRVQLNGASTPSMTLSVGVNLQQ